MDDDPKMQMYEAQAMVIERERELQEAQREIQQLRLDNAQQRIDQAIAATEKKFKDKLAELQKNAEEKTQQAVSEAEKNFESRLTKIQTNAEERTQQAISEAEKKFENKLTEIRKIIKEERQAQTKLERSLNERVGVVEAKVEEMAGLCTDLQRRIDEQSGEIEILRAVQLERADLVEKANEETKTMMEKMSIHLENVSSELGFHSSALVLGGWNDSMTDSIWIFDSNENKWRKFKQKLPFKVAYHGSAILNGKIYFMGGQNNLKEPLASCYKLEENGEWTKMVEMNEKRTAISQSTIVFGSEIWVIGGWNGINALKKVEKYNPQTVIWTKMPYLNFERTAPSASIVGEKIFVSGGWDGKKRLKSVEVYDPTKNKWEIFCDMPHELAAHCSIVEGNNLIIIGGRKSDETPLDEVWKLNVMDPKKKWIRMPSLKQGRFHHGAVKLSNRIMVFGGSIREKTRIDSVEIFDGISWTEEPKLSEIHSVFSSIPLSIKIEKKLLLQML